MKKILLGLALVAGVSAIPAMSLFAEKTDDALLVLAGNRSEAPAGFESLFNGKDLTGWKGKEGFWSVQDGAITGETKTDFKGPNTFLVWQGGEPANFELRFKYKIDSGNSGMQYRSKLVNEEAMQVGGYQGDFEAGTKYSGILYDEAGVAGKRGIMAERGTKVTYTTDGEKKVEKLPMTSEQLQASIKQGDWNEYTIIADGNHLTHKINGNVTAEVIDQSDKALTSGVLAIQVHAGGPMKVQVKDVFLKKLDAK
jgi:hypothetical protein